MSTPEDAAVVEAAVAALSPNAAGTKAPAAGPGAVARCDNCGADVSGRYCGNCGQRLEPPVNSLGHFIRVAFEDVTHADSRLWSTLWALLAKPGFLTHEFLIGHRARYLPPVRLYLVLSVAFFLWAGATHSGPGVIEVTTSDDGKPTAARVVPLAEASALAGGDARPGESVADRNARECGEIDYDGPWHATLTPAMRKACLKIRSDNARSLNTAFIHNLPRAMFVFLPLLAGSMMLLYWRPRHYYVEHLLLLVHNTAFVFLIVPLAWLLRTVLPFGSRAISLALVLYLAWYMFRSMRTVYAQSGWLTFGKLAAVGCFYGFFSVLMFTINFIYSALTLA